MFSHFSDNGPKSEPSHAARYCSKCGYELYADEEMICDDCLNEDNLTVEEDEEFPDLE